MRQKIPLPLSSADTSNIRKVDSVFYTKSISAEYFLGFVTSSKLLLASNYKIVTVFVHISIGFFQFLRLAQHYLIYPEIIFFMSTIIISKLKLDVFPGYIHI